MSETWWVNPSQLDDSQKEVVQLPLGGSHLVIGPPGSGKTNLLLLRANYLVRAGQPNVVILVFNRTLQEFIAHGSAQYSFPPNKVQTFRKWSAELLWQYGISASLPSGFEEQRKTLIEHVQQLIDSRKLKDIYDAILLDEAQDYLPEEIDVVLRLARSVFAVADVRQKIYKGEDAIQKLTSSLDTHELRYHYRNGLKICRVADALAKDGMASQLTPRANYDEKARPSSVTSQRCSSLEDQAQRIQEAVELQLKAYPGEPIGILCPKTDDLQAINEILNSTALQPLITYQSSHGYMSFDDTRPICLTTLHGAKGLEFRAVHIAAAEGLTKFPHQRNLTYMAITRAKTSLAIYHSGDLPGFLETALQSNAPPPPPPALADLFKK